MVMFLNINMERARAGVENAALFRARVFERHLGIAPMILTFKYDAQFYQVYDDLLGAGIVLPKTRFCNMYDYFQGFDNTGGALRSVDTPMPLNTKWKHIGIDGTQDIRIHDEDDRYIMYRKTSRTTGDLEYVNVFSNGKKWRRDTYTNGRFLSRIQFLNPDTGEPAYEHYLRSDGSVAMIQLYTTKNGKPSLSRISLFRKDGCCFEEFSSEDELITYWLEQITEDQSRQYIMISDRNRHYHRALRVLKAKHRKGSVQIVPVVHAVHTRSSFDVANSRTKDAYIDVLDYLDVQDAVIVSTEKQKSDIIARYGSGPVHVIPPVGNECANTLVIAPPERDVKRIVYLARYADEKHHPMAIRAFARVLQNVPDATLHLYGSGTRRGAIESLIAELGIESSIRVNGFVSDVAPIYRSAGLSLLTSRGEGYSMVVMESLCHGCPVI